jgi:endonuclease I
MIKKCLIAGILILISSLALAQTTLINWTFENTSRRSTITDDTSFQSAPYSADNGITGNIDTKTIKTEGRPLFSAWVAGSGGTGTFAPNTNTWTDGNGVKYWEISLSTTGYNSLTLSSKQYGSSTGPRDFKVQYSLDEATWTDVSGTIVTVASNWTSGVLNNVSLPSACDNKTVVYLRWIMTSNTSINGSTVAAAGTDRIDDISVKGQTSNLPTITVSESSLSGFTYILNNGPSAEQAFTVSGENLTSSILISAPTDYEVSTVSGNGYTSVTLYPVNGVIASTPVYLRLKASLPAGSYNNETVSITTTGATSKTVTCNGTVTTPTLTVSTYAISGFAYMVGMGPSTELSFTTGGTSLYSDLTINCPADYEISLVSDGSFGYSLSVTPVSNIVPSTTIYLRLKAGLAIGTYNNQEITVSASGATSQIISCSGNVTAGLPPDTPTALDATNITSSSFTAGWNEVANTSSYRLDVYTGSNNTATDLFISEYVEGSSNNKYIEIFNGTAETADLSDYRLQLYSNGSATPTSNIQLSGTLASGACIVYKNSSATLTLPVGVTATSNAAVNFNGDDALALYRISSSSFVDIFGNMGEDPGTEWGTSPLWTINTTLVRKNSVLSGVTSDPASGFPTLSTEWDYYTTDTALYLGSHVIGSKSISYVPGYQDLNVGNVASYPVTGLAESTQYHYVVRATNPHGITPSSNEIDVLTSSSTAPVINVTGTLSNFSATQGTPSATQSYTLTGTYLTDLITISIPAGFEISSDGGTTYATSSSTVPPTYNGTILVRLTGSSSGTYIGNLVHSSPAATTKNLYVSGTVTSATITVPTIQASGITGYPAYTSITLEWTPGNGAYRVVKVNTSNSFTTPTDGTSPAANTYFINSGEQVIYNGATEYIDGSPYNGCTITNLTPNTAYWFRIYDYNGTGVDTKYLATTATNNPKSFSTTSSTGSGYYGSIYGYGQTLKSSLHTLIKTTHTTQYSYTAVTTQLKYTDEDPNNTSNLIELYTGWSVDKNSYGAAATDWNKEHTWSKSHGDFGDVAPAGTDLHHLRPCDATVNSAKSNEDFNNGGYVYTDNSPPSGYTGETGCRDNDPISWEPRDADKGDVARMIMYMAVRYDGDDSNFNVNLEIVDHTNSDAGNYQPYYGKLATLLQWHVQDPPDSREMQRNNRVAERQGNRNPFIDMPGYAARVWTPCPLYNTNITTNSFTGNWSTPISATAYYLQVASDSLFANVVSGFSNLNVNLNPSSTVIGLTAGGTYYYRLRSYFEDDYSMYSPYRAVTLNQPVMPTATLIPSVALQEINLNGAAITLNLQNTTFNDATLLLSNFVLNSAPAGLTVQSVTWLSSTSARILLAFTGIDFDVNITSFSVTVNATELASAANLTTSVITIKAHVEGTALIVMDGSLLKLTITPVSGAGSYHVFSCTDPYGTYTETTTSGTFDLVNGNVWRISPGLDARKFFKVSFVLN